MASYVLDTLATVGVRQGVVVTGPEGSRVSKRLLEDPPGFPIRFVEQKIDRGTGDAVLAGLSGFDDFNDEEDVLIVPAEIPLLRPAMIERLLDAHTTTGAACTVLTVEAGVEGVAPGSTVGRIVRDRHGAVAAIRDAELDYEGYDDPLHGHWPRTAADEAGAVGGHEPAGIEMATGCSASAGASWLRPSAGPPRRTWPDRSSWPMWSRSWLHPGIPASPCSSTPPRT
jgi:hypothetical protein